MRALGQLLRRQSSEPAGLRHRPQASLPAICVPRRSANGSSDSRLRFPRQGLSKSRCLQPHSMPCGHRWKIFASPIRLETKCRFSSSVPRQSREGRHRSSGQDEHPSAIMKQGAHAESVSNAKTRRLIRGRNFAFAMTKASRCQFEGASFQWFVAC